MMRVNGASPNDGVFGLMTRTFLFAACAAIALTAGPAHAYKSTWIPPLGLSGEDEQTYDRELDNSWFEHREMEQMRHDLETEMETQRYEMENERNAIEGIERAERAAGAHAPFDAYTGPVTPISPQRAEENQQNLRTLTELGEWLAKNAQPAPIPPPLATPAEPR